MGKLHNPSAIRMQIAANTLTPMPMSNVLPEVLSVQRGQIVFVHIALLPILSKHDLLIHYQLPNLKALRRKVLTDEVLEQAGIKPEDYQYKSIFTAAQTVRLYDVLGITWLRTNQKI